MKRFRVYDKWLHETLEQSDTNDYSYRDKENMWICDITDAFEDPVRFVVQENTGVKDVFGRYISGISGDYLFHSVPYYSMSEEDLELAEFNKLGEQASQGCVRLAVSDAKWVYDNCPTGTNVSIYDDAENAGPLGKPDAIKITDFTNKWDPTDSNKKCPYAKATPIISGANDYTIKSGGEFYALAGVTAVDTCGNDITSNIEVFGNVVTTRKGKYKVTYSVTDVLKRTSNVTITVTVQ